MIDQQEIGDIGFILTKAPLENSFSKKILELAMTARNRDKKVGFFLISDGIYLVKNNQENEISYLLKKLLTKNIEIIVSKDHLKSSGISEDEILDSVTIAEKPYDELVDFVMERYERVITI